MTIDLYNFCGKTKKSLASLDESLHMIKYKQFFEKLMYVVLIAKHQSGKTLSVG